LSGDDFWFREDVWWCQTPIINELLRYSSEINLSFLKEKRFAFLTRMAKAVPVYKATVPSMPLS